MIIKIGIGLLVFVLAIAVIGYVLPAGAELRHEITIMAKPDKVWEILANLEGVQHYNQTVVSARYLTEQKTGIGASRHCDLKDGSAVKETIIGWESGKAVTMQLTESPWPVEDMKWRTELIPAGDSTTVKQVLTYKMKLGPIGRILNALVMRKKMNETIGQVFQNLKLYAEKK